MAMSNAERQRKWVAKNRALHNLRRRNKRKDLSSPKEEASSCGVRRGVEPEGSNGVEQSPPAQLSEVERLRVLMEKSSAEPVEAAVKPVVFRDDHGRVITERQWETLQRLKAKAQAGGYELDDYIQ